MKKLTEEMVIARAKISDMSKIKRLNCWGSELADVSLLRKMPNVEVLSLSINKISNLSDFELCRQLQELYVRQNEIRDLNQVCYLQNLSNLKHLWLGENPCADTDGYRLAVIRALPQLQKLDNIVIQPEELAEAMKKGKVLYHPQEQQEQEEEYELPPAQHYQQPNNYRNQGDYPEPYYQSPDRSPPRQEPEYDPSDPVDCYEEEDRREFESPPRQRRPSDQRRSYTPDAEPAPVYYDDRRNANSYDQDSPRHQHYYDRSPTKEYIEEQRITPDSPREAKIIPNSQSNNSMKSNKSWLPSCVSFKDYIEDPNICEKAKMLLNAQIIPRNSHSAKSMRARKSKCCTSKVSAPRSEKSRRVIHHPPKELVTELVIDIPKEEIMIPPVEICCEKEYTNGDRHYHQSQYRQEGSDGSNHSHSGVYDQTRRDQSCDKNSCPSNHRPPFNRRRVTRNSNILSAVLCLVKELDYPSLEVVEMAVRCRMDELEE